MTKNLTIFVLLFFGYYYYAAAQDELECGTNIDSSNFTYLQQLNEKWAESEYKINTNYSGATHFVPVMIHIIRQSNGSGGIASDEALQAMDRLNELYIHASIQFYVCSDVQYINNSTYYDYDKSQMTDLDAAYSVPNVINLYIAGTVSNGNNGLCGHAQFPGGLDFVILSMTCMQNGSTLAHEMGHYFGVYHTHSTSFGAESADGSDCAVDGDLFCDTPADPKLSTSSNLDKEGCIYYGDELDENNDPYQPSVVNIMSYSYKGCRTELTTEQMNKLLWTLQNEREYLTCDLPELTSFFYVDPVDGCEHDKMIQFYNGSVGAMSYNWDFGDGMGTSNLESPSYNYAEDGVYTVSLTVSDGNTNSISYQKVAVGQAELPYFNDFEAGASSLDQFEDHSTYKSEVLVHSSGAHNSDFGLVFHAKFLVSTSPYFQVPTIDQVFEPLWNPYFKGKMQLCVDATGYQNLVLEFDKKQITYANGMYSNFQITINGNPISEVIQVNNNIDDSNFSHLQFDLSAYDGQIFVLGLEGSHRYHRDYSGSNNGTATFIDNLSISGTLMPLPITLSYFNAALQGDQVLIKWQTLQEINNDYFTLERSGDGINWEQWRIIKGAINAQTSLNYRVIDRDPLDHTSYYRLKQTDLDGQFSYSNVQIIHRAVTSSQFTIFPNPVGHELNLKGGELLDDELSIKNIYGQVIIHALFIPKNGHQYSIDVAHLPSGLYFLEYGNGSVGLPFYKL